MSTPFYFLAALFLVIAEGIDSLQSKFVRWWKREPELYRECRTVLVDEGERLIASGEGWQYAGYGIGDSMHVCRTVDKDGKVFTTQTGLPA